VKCRAVQNSKPGRAIGRVFFVAQDPSDHAQTKARRRSNDFDPSINQSPWHRFGER